MTKKLQLLGLLLISFVLIPLNVKAADYKTLDFRETLAEEEIEEAFKNYKPNSDAITIYLFRGKGCGYCHRFLDFMNSITDEYGKYFKMESYEVWNDSNNSKLLGEVSEYLGQEAGGVPYIIIGDQVFPGYADTYDDGIKAAIKEQYEADTRYDVFEEYNKAIDKAKKDASGNAGTIIFWNFVFLAAATGIILYYNNKNYKKLYAMLDKKEAKKTEVKEEKREVKKVSNAKKKKK